MRINNEKNARIITILASIFLMAEKKGFEPLLQFPILLP